MTMPKKGRRTIVVNGIKYYWKRKQTKHVAETKVTYETKLIMENTKTGKIKITNFPNTASITPKLVEMTIYEEFGL